MNRKRMCSRFLAISLTIAAFVFCSSSLLRAEDNTTTIISGTVSNNDGASFYVGNTGINNYLEINSAGVLTNVINGRIGYNASASNNNVVVTGANSSWYNSDNLFIGSRGSGNTLTITNGGAVYNTIGYIGYLSASNNAVTVTSSGSVWSNTSSLFVGFGDSSCSTLIITNGGTVYDTVGYIGYTNNNNIATVTGLDSVWINSSNLYVGWGGSDNMLTIAASGTVYSVNGYIGQELFINNVTKNTVTVTGSGSVWNNSGDLYIGYGNPSYICSNNTLIIANSGAVVVGGNAYVSYTGGTGNQLTVANGSLTVTNGLLNIQNGTLTFNGGTITVNNLYATNSVNSVVAFNSGLLSVVSATVSNGSAFVVGDGANLATLNLRGGYSSFANGLVITNNATITGNGTIRDGNVQIKNGGTLSPGNSIGTLVFSNNLTLAGTMSIELDNLPGAVGTGDFVNVVGQLDITGGTLNFTALNTLTNGVYVFGQYGSWLGDLASTNNVPSGYFLNTAYNGNKLALEAVPEPSALTLVGGGLLGIVALLRRKRSQVP